MTKSILRQGLVGIYLLLITMAVMADTTADQQAAFNAQALAALTQQAAASTSPDVLQALGQRDPAGSTDAPSAVATPKAVPNGGLDKGVNKPTAPTTTTSVMAEPTSPVSTVFGKTTQGIKALGNAVAKPFVSTTSLTTKKADMLTDNVEHLVWDKTPISVTLSVGQERLISFPNEVRFGYDATTLTSDTLKVQNNAGTLYLLAKQSFTTQRVVVKDLSNGNMILIDLQAVNSTGNTTPLAIVFDTTNKTMSSLSTTENHTDDHTVTDDEYGMYDYVTLTRFAAQQLYAPKRLLQSPPGIKRVPLNTHKTVRLLRGDTLTAMPLISWHGGHYYVTAILVRNRQTQSINLDPRLLLGTWKTATFQRNTLDATGSTYDSTVLYLISARPFSESLVSIRGDL